MADLDVGLSEKQKSCLRLVARGCSSKEIALQIGLSPSTVDTYIKTSMARLGASNRREAARLLETLEASQELGSPSRELGGGSVAVQPGEVAAGRGWIEAIAPPPIGGRLNTLSVAERTLAIMRVAGIGLAVVIALTLVVAGVFRTFG